MMLTKPRIKPHLTYEECIRKYPRLTTALMIVLIGSPGEAGCVLRDYRDGHNFSCEACSHSGLTPLDRIRDASKQFTRHYLLKYAQHDRRYIKTQYGR